MFIVIPVTLFNFIGVLQMCNFILFLIIHYVKLVSLSTVLDSKYQLKVIL